MAKAHSIDVTILRAGRRRNWRWVGRASRALLRALHESRARMARKIILDHRHLFDGDTAIPHGVTPPKRDVRKPL